MYSPELADRNKATVLRFYKAFDTRDFEQALGLLSQNFTAHMAGLPDPLNTEGFNEFGYAFFLAFPDGQHTFHQVLVEGNKVVTCGTFVGTHQRELQNLPPTGKRISMCVMHIDVVEDDKIVEHWGQGDQFGLIQQLGVVIFPGPKLLPKIFKSMADRLVAKFVKSDNLK